MSALKLFTVATFTLSTQFIKPNLPNLLVAYNYNLSRGGQVLRPNMKIVCELHVDTLLHVRDTEQR